jgi:hypothetical protein
MSGCLGGWAGAGGQPSRRGGGRKGRPSRGGADVPYRIDRKHARGCHVTSSEVARDGAFIFAEVCGKPDQSSRPVGVHRRQPAARTEKEDRVAQAAGRRIHVKEKKPRRVRLAQMSGPRSERAANLGAGAAGGYSTRPRNRMPRLQPRRSCSAQSAAPMIPASFRNSAGTILTRGLTYLKNFECFALTPPPIMISSGQRIGSRMSM